MPRKTVNTTYQRAQRPSMTRETTRKPYMHPMRKVEPLSKLAQYVEDNQGDRSILETIREFQQTHKHTWKILAASGHYHSGTTIYECADCGLLRLALVRKKLTP